MYDQFRNVPLLTHLTDGDLARICRGAQNLRLEAGDVLFREGDPGDHAFIVTAGQLEVLKEGQQRQVLLALPGAGEVIGEMSLLRQEPRSATVRARTRTDLVSISRTALDDLLQTSPSATRSVFETLVRRMGEGHEQLRHQDRMAQLGSLTAGVAHELNNPAAAVERAAKQFADELDRFIGWLAGRSGWTNAIEMLRHRPSAARDPLEVSHQESAVEDWLADRGVDEAWEVAPALVDAGIGLDELGSIAETADVGDAARFLASAGTLRRAAGEIAEGSHRLSDIVGVLRSYAYLDRAPVQEVDVVRGIEDALVVLGHATAGVRIVRDYADPLPTITALGSELNQVWTDLIHNACDAVSGVPDPTVTLRAYQDADDVVVEVEDNGPGIPPDAQSRIFDLSYTTRPSRPGSGLGLPISYRIVVLEHDGELTLRSEAGRTIFRVTLPIHARSDEAAAGAT